MASRPKRALLELAVAVAAFALGALLFRQIVPTAEGNLALKLEYYEQHADEFDAVFIGSSRVQHGIDPVVFDAELAFNGVPLRSFNLGAGGMRTFESDYLLHRILSAKPPRLRWIFFELGPLGVTLPNHNPLREYPESRSARGAQWHTPAQTLKVMRATVRVPASFAQKLEWSRLHLDMFARNLSNVGRGRELAEPFLETPTQRRARESFLDVSCGRLRGYEAAEAKDGLLFAPELVAFAKNPERNRKLIERLSKQNERRVDLDDVDVETPLAQQRHSARRGVRLVYITTPGREGSPEQLRLHEAGLLSPLLHFNDPERYPELFELDHRYDPGHLNRRGVEIFSRLLANALVDEGLMVPEEDE